MTPTVSMHPETKTLRVVLIEDVRDVREGLAALINGTADYKCVAAYGMMETALARIKQDQPDIILTDLEMPVIDGWEATRRLKGDPQTRDIPIIALSAHALAGEREKALAAGADEFDTKPIEFERLVATLRRVIAARK